MCPYLGKPWDKAVPVFGSRLYPRVPSGLGQNGTRWEQGVECTGSQVEWDRLVHGVSGWYWWGKVGWEKEKAPWRRCQGSLVEGDVIVELVKKLKIKNYSSKS